MAWIKSDDLGFEDYTINTLHSRSVESLLLFVKTLTEEIKRYREEKHTEHTPPLIFELISQPPTVLVLIFVVTRS